MQFKLSQYEFKDSNSDDWQRVPEKLVLEKLVDVFDPLTPLLVEMIQGKEVLIYNITQKESKKLKTFDDLRKLKQKKNILIIAPHPYFIIRSCLGKQLDKNIDLFDAIEYSHYYLKYLTVCKH